MNPSDEDFLKELQRNTFRYFTQHYNAANGLVPDNTQGGMPASITAVGLALAAYPIAVERGYLARGQAIAKTLTTLRFFWHSPHGPTIDAIGHNGFYYHFLDMESGRRAINAELSTIDSTFLLAGALTAGQYFNRDTAAEREIRELADGLYRRANWQWALDGGATVTHGWRPEGGFLKWRWEGYSEALLLYVLALASPTFPIPPQSYRAWTETYEWKHLYGYDFLYAGPLFIHQLSHVWIDFRDIQDEYMDGKGIDYFENSRRATYVQQAYAMDNPQQFAGYGERSWGITASAGPGPARKTVNGKEREFFGYKARAVPDGPDDGTLSPWASIASLPFAPEIVVPAIRHFDETYPEMTSELGFRCSFNPTFGGGSSSWISKGYYGLNQGPIVIMIENHLSGMIWHLMRRCPAIVTGLRRAGFRGGWLQGTAAQN